LQLSLQTQKLIKMKSASFFMLSLLLVVAILAPAIVTLVDANHQTELLMDFNEEENKKEEKKETKEKKLFSFSDFDTHLGENGDFSRFSSFYLEKNYSISTSIFLPPPEHTS